MLPQQSIYFFDQPSENSSLASPFLVKFKPFNPLPPLGEYGYFLEPDIIIF